MGITIFKLLVWGGISSDIQWEIIFMARHYTYMVNFDDLRRQQ